MNFLLSALEAPQLSALPNHLPLRLHKIITGECLLRMSVWFKTKSIVLIKFLNYTRKDPLEHLYGNSWLVSSCGSQNYISENLELNGSQIY